MTKNVISRMSHSLGRRDEEPNILLAHELARTEDIDRIQLVAETLKMAATRHKKMQLKSSTKSVSPTLL